MWMMPVGSMGSSRKRSSNPEQSLGADEEDGGHDGEDDGDRGLGPEQGHQALGHAHEEPRRDGAQEIPEPRERDDHEGDAEHVHAHEGIEPADGRGQGPRDPREHAAQGEGGGEEAMDVDAEEGDHLLVLDARAHDRPGARDLEEEPRLEYIQICGDYDEEPTIQDISYTI